MKFNVFNAAVYKNAKNTAMHLSENRNTLLTICLHCTRLKESSQTSPILPSASLHSDLKLLLAVTG